YKYSHYIINFICNISYVYYFLIRLPRESNSIILRPYKLKDKPRITRRVK
ncbi:hypothetical protein QR685DRAFT_451132, partial [Neurospora intermedia]